MNSLFNVVVSRYLNRRFRQIRHFTEHPHEVQEALFFRLIRQAKNTAWGRQYDYTGIGSLEAYKNRVPVQDYDGFKPWIQRLMQGEQQLLWPDPIRWFAKSSGTTSDKSKFIPVSSVALRDGHFKGGTDVMTMYCHNHPGTRLFTGKGLIMGGSSQVNRLDGSKGSKYGDISAVMMTNMPRLAHWINTPSLSIALMDEWEEKIDKMARTTLSKKITQIAGVPTWTLVLFKKLFELTGKSDISEIWPSLELYIHGGVSFTPYREQFRSLISSTHMNYVETYNASEGFFAFQDLPSSDELLLMLDHGIFYEFMPLEELGKEHPATVQLEDVELHKNYALVISTNAGLWRYLIGDTIHFTSKYPYRIQVTGRTRHFINAFGEEVIVENADQSIAHACRKTGASVKEYSAAPIYFSGQQKGGHEWLVEFEKAPEDLAAFTLALDKHLQSINSDYEAKRYKNMALELPKIHALPAGTFYNWLRSKGKLGGQHKVPRLANHRKYVDELLQFYRDSR